MQKILLIKTGAAGDIVRTTVLLNALAGKITWVLDSRYRDILPENHPALDRVISPEYAANALECEFFDLVISLEEDEQCARLASSMQTRQLVGIYWSDNKIQYTPASGGWFDMSLVSAKGQGVANQAKLQNNRSFQHFLFGMLGMTFRGEPYLVYRNDGIVPEKNQIGIETRCGARWPNKVWSGYAALAARLKEEGYHCKMLLQQETMRKYLDEIASCSGIICGDTLAMHVALAYRIPVVGIFNCTSPAEIFDYGLLEKVVSPLLEDSFYSREYDPRVVGSITPDRVYQAFRDHTALKL